MKRLLAAAFIPVTLAVCFWLIKIAENIYGIDLTQLGIYPRQINGLIGIITSPLIHSNFDHLFANTLPFLAMGTALFYFYRGISLKIFLYIWFFSGLYVWFFGRSAWHIGSSGLDHGLFAFLFASGLIRKNRELIAISLLSVFLYGSMVWGFVPNLFPGKNISHEAHAGGLLIGIILTFVYRNKGPKTKEFYWAEEPDAAPENFSQIKIVIDSAIPFIKGVFEAYADVLYIEGHRISASDIYDADVLIIRTRTKCDRKLLDGSKIRFIATCTIGFDHIDTDYCRKNGIEWRNAPGCNSGSVMQYMASALSMLALEKNMVLKGKTIGIIGVGHVGKKVTLLAEIFEMKTLLYDPPRALIEGSEGFCSLETIQQEADIITFHVPLQQSPPDATFYFGDDYFFNRLLRKPFIINTSRGEVLDTVALKSALTMEKISGVILDVFENEPDIDKELLQQCFLATPHIAGYSADGKANGTEMMVREVGKFFGFPLNTWRVSEIPNPEFPLIFPEKYVGFWTLAYCILESYSIFHDSEQLKSNPSRLENLRNHYPTRREYDAYTVCCKNMPCEIKSDLLKLGFKIQDQDVDASENSEMHVS